eukprot:TRINITY_DN1061_c0_g1_i3.p2 TRINITY_DN1061_c0_g1~~TRINITY_DN1061_c0_g1_i3.p2  ORF type:complete len:198 (+),score=55.06 TRINITY_DN1061_c0_g1_i3:234-827(+)
MCNEICQDWSMEEIAAARRLEAFSAASVLGIPQENVMLLDYEDTMLTSYPEQEVRARLVAVIRRWKPYVVMSWSPFPNFKLTPNTGWDDLGFHPDHQASGALALASKFDAGVGLLWPDFGASFSPSEFYMWEILTPTHYVDISSVIASKVNAYAQHKTQYDGDLSGIAWMIKFWASGTANNTQVPGLTYAEGFVSYW